MVNFEAVNKDFRYEIAKTDTGEMYLVDMGFPVFSYFLWIVHYLIPKRCYPISSETAKKLPTQKKSDTVSPSLAGGIGVLISAFVLHTDDIFSVSWSSNTKIAILILMVMVVVGWRFYHLRSAKKLAIKTGAVIDSDTLQLIRFRPVEIKFIVLVTTLMIIEYGCLITFLFFIFSSTVNIFILLSFWFLLFANVVIASIVFAPKGLFVFQKMKNKRL